MSKAVLLGPYVGDFTQEILVFRPYIRYISHTMDDMNIFISSHSNRSFLYEWIDPDRFLPIYDHISRNELNQTGFTYNDITKTEFNQITKKIRENIDFDDIDTFTLPYVKNTNGISYYQKFHTPFSIPDMEDDFGDISIVGIFDKSDQSIEVYDLLSDRFNISVIGDMNNGLEEHNKLMRNTDFSSNNYLRMFNYIKRSKLVVTNCRDWVLICNCQGIPVFYWGYDSSLYKSDGALNFGNKKCTSVCNMDSSSILDMINYSYKRLEE